ncbi:bifunctional phosphoserine phosphatase/homoserine phosphotransferase ThrH [Paraperlucidibaca wandonensis]|jgi:phosphoserine/homoserine phosphotransferase|uniref:phosphoserine phosphatase n=1 Tax=Paraperlucidibaca wandonensis TaxID=1268273 RepID=A0ABW3HDZ4_9GAMM|nr:bifunctional phosphoserine phosphatase/homoserine phosphotransferase ThrH [Paraperlucidibaca sp.]MBQ0722244.1 bifunctional phosphoserine phosphatase/homoserine phosphotransferase ThrH [Paraperlucidibaca sp.]MBQ0842667.1 bifunctional phosphoserine phosphatase/homoserine phosphotransferase ThrH [Paraperlucidibaca sp.]|tara:strand:- start:214 stop:828 length:615 start_codon:yes stop_codon:yes gene_type:complete
MELVCLDLEGVLVPEIWINVAKRTGIKELEATTRDIPDYDVLMKQRLAICKEHKLGLPDIQAVIADMGPIPGAYEFLAWVREHFQLIILSDTFYEFAHPLMRQLDWPTLFCHKLEVAADGTITDYKLRQPDQKRAAIKAFHSLNYRCIAAGDSYNDTNMLGEAEQGILFDAPENVIREFPQFPVTTTYEELKAEIRKASLRQIP